MKRWRTKVVSYQDTRPLRLLVPIQGVSGAENADLPIPPVREGDDRNATVMELKPFQAQVLPRHEAPIRLRISYESSFIGERYKVLAARRTKLQKSLAQIRLQIGRHEFQRIMGMYTRWVIRKVWDRKSWTTIRRPDLLFWNTVYDYRYISKLQRLRELASDLSSTRAVRRKARRTLAWLDREPAVKRAWATTMVKVRSNPRKILVRRIKLPPKRVRKLVSKRIPVRNWDAIRRVWVRRVARLRPNYERLERELLTVRKAIGEMIGALRFTSNRAFQACDTTPLPYSTEMYYPRMHTLASHLTLRGPDDWVSPLRYIEAGMPTIPSPTFSRFESCLDRSIICRFAAIPAEEALTLTFEQLLDRVSSEWVAVLPRTDCVESPYHAFYWQENFASETGALSSVFDVFKASAPDMVPDVWYEPELYGSYREREVSMVDVGNREEAAQVRGPYLSSIVEGKYRAFYSLRSLDIGNDAYTFNLARSIGELKDTPKTLDTGRDFFLWLRARDWSRLNAFQVTRATGTSVTVTDSLLEKMIGRKAAYTPEGLAEFLTAQRGANRITRIRKVRPSSLTTVAMFASLYLAHKWAVEPTVSDINKVVRYGWAWASAVRRGLGRMLESRLGQRETVVLRRGFSSENPLHIKRRAVLVDVNPPAGLDDKYEVEDSIHIPHTLIPFLVDPDKIFDQDGIEELPLYGGSKIPCIRWHSGAYAPIMPLVPVQEREEVRKVTALLNEEVAKRQLPKYLTETQILFARRYLGWVYGAYDVAALNEELEAIGRNRIVQAQPLRTVWELSPLSFVTEWFTNLTELTTIANAIVNSKFTKAMPRGTAWVAESERLYLGSYPHLGETCPVRARCRFQNEFAGFFTGSFGTSESSRPWWSGFVRHFEDARIHLTLDTSQAHDKGATLSRSDIRAFRRTPMIDLGPLRPKPRIKLSTTVPKLGSLGGILLSGLGINVKR